MSPPKSKTQHRRTTTARVAILLSILIVGGLIIAYWATQSLRENTQDIGYYAIGGRAAQAYCDKNMATAKAGNSTNSTEIQAIGHRFTTFDDPDILCELDAVGDLSNAWVKTDTRKATHELAYVARGYAGMNAEMIAVFQPKTL